MFSSGFIEGNPPASGDVSQAGMGTEDAANDDSDMSSVGSDEDLMEYDSFDEDDEEDDTDAVPSTKRPDSANTGDEDELEENDGEDEQTAHTSIAQNENEDLEEVYVAAESQMEGAEGHSDETVPAALGGQQVGLSPRGPSSLTTSTMRSASAMLHSGAPFPTAGGQKTLVRQNSALSSVSAADNEASVSTSSNRPAHSRKRSRSGNSRAEDSGRRYTEVVVTDATLALLSDTLKGIFQADQSCLQLFGLQSASLLPLHRRDRLRAPVLDIHPCERLCRPGRGAGKQIPGRQYLQLSALYSSRTTLDETTLHPSCPSGSKAPLSPPCLRQIWSVARKRSTSSQTSSTCLSLKRERLSISYPP